MIVVPVSLNLVGLQHRLCDFWRFEDLRPSW